MAGRSHECAVLARGLAKARSGRAQCVVVRGASGTGKTRLLTEIRQYDWAGSFTVLRVTCAEVPPSRYGAVRALFHPLDLAADAGSAVRAGAATRALPVLRPDLPHSPDDESPGDQATLHGLYRAAANLMSTAPLVIVVDDAHRCDEDSLRWLDFLLRRAEDLPLLLLLACRGDELEDPAQTVVSDIVAQRASTVLELTPLVQADVGEVVAEAFDEPPHSRFVATCARVSGGNPLLLDRLLSELSRAGVSPDAEGAAAVEDVGRDVVADSVLSRLSGQPDRVRGVAAAAAVLGPGAGAESLAALAGVTRWQVAEALGVLREHNILAASGADFVHDVVRTAVLEATRVSESERLRAARILNDAGRPAVEVANHLLALSELNQTWMAGVLHDAAVLEERRGDPEAAVRYLRRVLDVETSEPQRIRIRADLGRVLAQIDPYAALPILRELLNQVTDPDVHVSLVLNFATTAATAQRHPEAVRVLGEVLAMLSAGRDASPADHELCLAVESMLLIIGAGEKSTFGIVRARVRERAIPEGSTSAERRTLAAIAYVEALRGAPSGRVVEHARTALGFQANDADVWTERAALFALHLADEADDLLPAAQRSVEKVKNMGARWDYSYSLSCYARVLLHFGDVREAAAEARTAAELCEGTSGADSTAAQFTAWASALIEQGRIEQAERLLDRIDRAWFEESILEWHYFLHAKARARYLRGDETAAVQLLLRCGDSMNDAGVGNPIFAPWRVDAARLLAGLGRRSEAVDLIEAGDEAVQRWGTARAIGRQLMARGAVADDPSQAVASLTDAVEVLSGSPAWLEEARAHHCLGAALLRTEDVRSARKHLRRAIDLATLCGSRPIAENARALAVTAGGRVGQPLRSPVDLLTGSERRVATMAASGTSNREIAEALFVTLRTVETHLTSAYRKLRVSRRADLAIAIGGARTD
ncbi:AAA family ATPase [Saccharopolyspora halophila]|uniref:AAA family ATPase n=1 Tax=Saccharopolyspora halophila TaxID=405551 RepID=UPI0031D35B90